jgi:hypothetical protein
LKKTFIKIDYRKVKAQIKASHPLQHSLRIYKKDSLKSHPLLVLHWHNRINLENQISSCSKIDNKLVGLLVKVIKIEDQLDSNKIKKNLEKKQKNKLKK